MKFTKNFNQLRKNDVGIAGGKGASLGEMTNSKIPVPPGFVVTANAFERFLIETDLTQDIQAQLDKINFKDTNSVNNASEVIRDLIHDAAFPNDLKKEVLINLKKLKSKYVAVRSSATAEDSSLASWAGELETYLNTSEKNLIKNIQNCWSSLFTPRAIFYRHEKKLLKSKVFVAVVVQKMIQSEISGVAFTVHPVTQDTNQMIIEAGYGLGEALVSGQITPDSYVIDKRDFSLIDINVSEQKKLLMLKITSGVAWKSVSKNLSSRQKLNGQKIIELSKLCVQIEKHYKKPQDIEWALESGKFYITQSRPITTLNKSE